MQKFLRTLMLAALMLPFVSQAQNTLTVADGTETNSNVPIYGLWADAYLRCQTIYPASEIEAAATTTGMTGGTISSLTYYLSTPAAEAWTGTWEVKLMEVSATTLSAFVDMTTATTVYTGTLDGTGSTMTITFSTPYTYNGGNLLIEVSETTSGNYKSASFYGVTATGASWQGYSSSSWASITGSAKAFIPKTTFTFTGGTTITCFPVNNLAASNITSTTATLTWSGNASGYTLYEYANTDSADYMYTDTFAVLNTLQPNTEYTFGVVSDCGADGESAMRTVTFRTECAAMSLPYTMGFEEADLMGTTNMERFPYCWTRINNSTSTTYNIYPYSYSTTTYAHTGSRALYFTGGTGTTIPDTQVAVLPQLDVDSYPMNGNRLTFWGSASSSNNKTVLIGTMTDPTDMSTFTVIDSFVVSGTTPTLYSIPLTSAVATDPYVAISLRKSTGSLYIDDVTLEVMPSCLEVSNVTASNITSSSVTLTWVDASNSSATYTIYDMADTSVVGTATDTTFTVTGLDPNTQYTFGVEANCPLGDATVMTVNTRTACGIFEASYTWNFEDMPTGAAPLCWTKLTGGNANVTSGSGETYYHSATKYIQFSGVAGNNILLLPETEDEISTLQLRFWTRPESTTNSNCGTFSVGYYYDTLFVAVETYTYSDFSAYTEKTVTFGTAPAGARMAMRHDATSTAWYWRVDDVTIEEAPSCLPVTGLTANAITAEGATLSWNGTAAGSYTVVNMADGSVVTSGADTTYTLTGLTAMTQYSYGVVANCTGSNSDTVVVTFNTACTALTLPYTEGFELTSNAIGCWSVEGTGNWTVGTGDYSTTTGAFEGTYNAKITHGTTGNVTKLVSPALDGVENGLLLDFAYVMRAWGSDLDELRVYSRASDTAAWQMIAEYTDAAATWTVANVIIPGTVYQVAFEYTDNYGYGLGIDSVVFTPMSGSFCFPVADLAVDSVTATSVFLSWSDENNTGATYSIYGNEGNVIATNVAGTSYEVTGLTALTGYTFGVAANCSAEESSDVATIGAVTGCAGATCNLYIFAEDSYGDGWNGASIDVMQGGAVVANYTLLDTAEIAFVEVCASAPVSFVWNSGSYDDEASFLIFDINGDSLFAAEDASDLTDGAVFFTTATPCSEVSDEVTFTIAVNDATMGTTTPAPGIHTYEVGDTLIITAAANDGYRLAAWNLNIPGLGDTTVSAEGRNPINTIVNAALDGVTITAIFAVEVPEATIAASDILYWVGEGSNQAVLAINWPDTALAWGYRFNGTATVQDMLDDIANADPRFSYSVEEGYLSDFYFLCEDGMILSGAMDGYWESKNNGISDMGLFQTLNNGDFEKWANSAAGVVVDSVYYEGWGWSYIYNYPMTIHPVSVPAAETVTITFTVNDATMGTITPSGVRIFEVGDILTVTATPFEGYRLAAWQLTLDGETLIATEDITNTYTDTVFADIDGAIITAVFERETGIDEVESADFQAYSLNGKVIVKGVENMDVNVYDVTGRSVNNVAKAAETVEFTVPAAGVYMVKVGNAVKRVVVIR